MTMNIVQAVERAKSYGAVTYLCGFGYYVPVAQLLKFHGREPWEFTLPTWGSPEGCVGRLAPCWPERGIGSTMMRGVYDVYTRAASTEAEVAAALATDDAAIALAEPA